MRVAANAFKYEIVDTAGKRLPREIETVRGGLFNAAFDNFDRTYAIARADFDDFACLVTTRLGGEPESALRHERR